MGRFQRPPGLLQIVCVRSYRTWLALPTIVPNVERRNVTTFSDLQLSEPLLRALAAEGYEKPTPIQAQSIPSLLTGKDLLGIAQTGTGKTAAFALPILQKLAAHPERAAKGTCRALILSPTRELASQIGESFRVYGKFLKVTRAVVFGGVSLSKQIDILRGGVDVVVATPGRLVDLIEQCAIATDDRGHFEDPKLERLLERVVDRVAVEILSLIHI